MLILFKYFFLSIFILLTAQNVLFSQQIVEKEISGTIFLDEENYIHFDDIYYIHGFIASTSRLNRYKAFKIILNNTIRVIPISILKYIKVEKYQLDIGQEGTPVIKDLTLRLETKNKDLFELPYFELDWVSVKIYDVESKQFEEKRINFNENGKLNILKIVFD